MITKIAKNCREIAKNPRKLSFKSAKILQNCHRIAKILQKLPQNPAESRVIPKTVQFWLAPAQVTCCQNGPPDLPLIFSRAFYPDPFALLRPNIFNDDDDDDADDAGRNKIARDAKYPEVLPPPTPTPPPTSGLRITGNELCGFYDAASDWWNQMKVDVIYINWMRNRRNWWHRSGVASVLGVDS